MLWSLLYITLLPYVDVLWSNVGKTHKSLEIGQLLSLAFTVALCLFWTVIIAFCASLSSIEGLRSVDFIDKALNKTPFLVPLLAQLAPFIVVGVNAALRSILGFLAGLELPISVAMLEASTLTKMAWFMIIQNFFVASIGGASIKAYSEFTDITKVATLLGTSLPSQSTFHIQILLVNVFLSIGLELLGVSRIAVATIRKYVGPNLNEKERRSTWMGLAPMNNPAPFTHSLYQAWNVLYFQVIMVYSTIAPLSAFLMGLCFMIMWMGYRYLFVYVYPPTPDSGGRMYFTVLNICLFQMIISELTVLVLLGIKGSPLGSTLMIPLVVITMLFNIYVKKQHFATAEILPGDKCLKVEMEHAQDGEDFDIDYLLKDAYKHPDLKAANEKKEAEAVEGHPGDDEVVQKC